MFRYVLLFFLVGASFCQDITTEEPSVPTVTDAPTTGKPTDKPTTVPPTTSTEKPTLAPTTTPEPTVVPTTTEEPTTVAPTTETTVEPDTSTVPPTTTAEPTTTSAPKPEWKAGNWSVTDLKTNVTCIVANMAVEFNVQYTKTDGTNATAVLMVPPTAEAKGQCGPDNQTLSLYYPNGQGNNEVTFIFESSGSASKNFMISSVEFNYLVTFPNATDEGKPKTLEDSHVDLFLTQVGKSYKCLSKLQVPMTDDQTHLNATLEMKEAQIEAFRTSDDTKFGVAVLCSLDEFTSDIVPIAVGCALAALVVIVIIAYLIGRRRARAKGYQSM